MSTITEKIIVMPEAEVQAIVREAEVQAIVRETVRQMFLNLGMNISDPDDLVTFQQDMHFLRKERNRRENMEVRIFTHVVLMAITAAASALGTLLLHGGI